MTRPSVPDLLDRTPLHALSDIPPGVLDHARAMAYECHHAGRYDQAEILCRGLLAVDARCPWTRALHAAVLHAGGRRKAALAELEEGLRHHPDDATLLALRGELLATPGFGEAA